MQNTEKNNSGVTFDTQSEASFGGSRYKRNYDNYKEISVKADAEKSRTEKNNFATVISVVAFTALFLGLSLFVTNTILQTKGMSLFFFFDLQTEAVCETGTGSSAGKTDFTFDVSAQTVKLQITYADGKGSGTGCGVILSSDGYIVADGALISGASEIKAVFANGETAAAEPVGSDKENGVSFLKAEFLFIALCFFKASSSNGIKLTVFCQLHSRDRTPTCYIGCSQYAPFYTHKYLHLPYTRLHTAFLIPHLYPIIHPT